MKSDAAMMRFWHAVCVVGGGCKSGGECGVERVRFCRVPVLHESRRFAAVCWAHRIDATASGGWIIEGRVAMSGIPQLDETELSLFIQAGLGVVALATAIAAGVSAKEAAHSARETHRSTQAQLLSGLLDDYASQDMQDAINLLRRWREKHGETFAQDFGKLHGRPVRIGRALDHARRRVAHYFEKVCELYNRHFIDADVLEAAAGRDQAGIHLDLIEPMEAVIRADYDRTSFQTLRHHYDMPSK